MKHAPSNTNPKKAKRCTHKTRTFRKDKGTKRRKRLFRTTSWEKKVDGRTHADGSRRAVEVEREESRNIEWTRSRSVKDCEIRASMAEQDECERFD